MEIEDRYMPLEIDTEQDFDIEDLQYDIEDSRETDRWNDAPPELKELFHVIEWNIIDGSTKTPSASSTRHSMRRSPPGP